MAMSDPPTLALEPTHARDQGVYTCRVDYRISSSTTAHVNLTVVIPPGPPIVLWRGRAVVGAVGPLGEAERTELTCRSSGGRPSPVLTWYQKGRRLPLLSANSSLDPFTGTYTVDATLSIQAMRELLGVTLTCHAHTPTDHHAHASSGRKVQDTAVVQPRTASVTLNITLSPVEVRVVGGGAGVRAGTTLRLVCRAVGSHPPAHLTWWRAHARLPHVTHAIEDGGNVTTATLTIVVSRQHDGATLSCTGANPALHHAPLTDTVTLVVFYAPVVGLGLGKNMNPDLIKEGDDVYFECNIEANPTFHRVDWHHNGVELVHNMSAGVVMNGLALVLRNLQRRHSGTYTCTAANTEGRTTSNAVHLTVRHTPVCAGEKRERTQGAARGSTAAVKCTVEAEPAHDLTWTWIRKRADGTEEEVPGEDVRSDGLTSSVLLTPHTPDDYGRLLCLASNAVGSQLTSCVVNLVPAGPPDMPTNCSATPGKPSAHSYIASLTIACVEGFDGGLPQHFQMEVWQQGNLIANMTSEYPEWHVTELRAGVGVSLRVSAHNARGRSDPLAMEVHTTSAQHHAAPDGDGGVVIAPIVGVALGLLGVLLLLLIMGVVIVKKLRSSSRPQKLVSPEVPLTPTIGEGFDPDVVASIQRRPPSLDVIPQDEQDDDDERSYVHERLHDELEDDSEMHSPRESCAYIHRGSDSSAHVHVDGQVFVQGDSDTCSCEHRQYGRHHQHGHRGVSEDSGDGQDVPATDSQSEDSGLSESESDSELRELMSEGEVAAVIRQHPDSGRTYVTYSQTSPDAEVHQVASDHIDLKTKPLSGELHSKASPIEVRLKPFVSREYRASPVSAEEMRLKPSSCRELRLIPASTGERRSARASPSDTRSPSSGAEMKSPIGSCGSKCHSTQREVVCLPISPGESPRSHNTRGQRSRDSYREETNPPQPSTTSKKVRPQSAKDLHFVPVSKEFPSHDQSKHKVKDRTDKGQSVTLVEGEHGEILLVTRRPSETDIMKGGRQCAPVFPSVKMLDSSERRATPPPTKPVTLPKAKASRKSRAGNEVLEHTSNHPPSTSSLLAQGGGQTKVSAVGKHSYHPPPHPDVCRRESSV
nr:nephrin-like [Cherax quadricarinatus]